MNIQGNDLLWVKRKWKLIRESQTLADAANTQWKSISAAIDDKLDAEGITDIVQLAQIKGSSIPLQDALDTGNWHARNSERHTHDIMLFLRLKELGIL